MLHEHEGLSSSVPGPNANYSKSKGGMPLKSDIMVDPGLCTHMLMCIYSYTHKSMLLRYERKKLTSFGFLLLFLFLKFFFKIGFFCVALAILEPTL